MCDRLIHPRRWSLALCVTLAMSVSSTAMAQSSELEPERAQLMLSHIREANDHYANKRWSEALEAYRAAYAISPQPALLYRMGKAAEGAGLTRDAIGYYEQFVAALPNEDAAKKVAQELPQLRATIPPRLTITSTPSKANIYIDSVSKAPIGSTPFDGELSPGEVTILIKRDGYQVYSQKFDFQGAEQETLNVTLVKEAQAVAGLEDSGSSSSSSGKTLKRVGGITAGAGVVMLGVGGVMSALQAQKTNEVNDFDKRAAGTPNAGRAELQALKDDANTYWRSAILLYSVGGLATAAGIGMFVIGNGREQQSEETITVTRRLRLELNPTIGGAHLGVSGSF